MFATGTSVSAWPQLLSSSVAANKIRRMLSRHSSCVHKHENWVHHNCRKHCCRHARHALAPASYIRYSCHLALLAPPLREQQAIASQLDEAIDEISTLTSRVEDAIGRLKEFRTALISAAVTGKIDVREQAA